ncbi:MAG TPA: c-type cytochrome [Gammaproteobacteria bacterium]
MNNKKTVLSMLVLGGLALSGAVLATPSGEMLGNTCAGCHGANGNTNGPATPGIAGINSEYFIDTMKGYADGSRKGTIMNRIAKGYTEDEIKAMAKYFAAQKYHPLPQQADPKLASVGKKLHSKSCEKCHEKGGRVSEDGGILAGQPMTYLQWTIEDFTSGKREMPKKMKAKMEEVHKAKGDEAYQALVNFYGSQK